MRHRDFGLLVCDQHRATPGFTLYSPNFGHETYLLGLRGDVVHQWRNHPAHPGNYAHLLENGNLLWSRHITEGNLPNTGGKGGRLRELDWNGKVVWEYRDLDQHHDFRRLANGNTLFLGWEAMQPENAGALRAGSRGPAIRMAASTAITFSRSRPGQDGMGMARCRDLEIEKYPLISNQLRDEFAHANAISPLENGDIYISFRRLNMIGLIDKQTKKMKWQHATTASACSTTVRRCRTATSPCSPTASTPRASRSRA